MTQILLPRYPFTSITKTSPYNKIKVYGNHFQVDHTSFIDIITYHNGVALILKHSGNIDGKIL